MSVMRAITGIFCLALLALVAAVSARAELSFPPFSSYVVDAANVLPPEAETALVAKLTAFQDKSGHQFAVATVPSLQGTSVEDYGNQLFRAWKLGDATRNDGALLLVAPNERKVRIEVGYGLEGDLTDAVAKLIIENAILPRFKAGDLAGGVSRGADDVMAVFSGHAEDFKARAAQKDEGPPFYFTVLFMLFWLVLAYLFIRSFRGGAGRRRGRSPWIIGTGAGSGWSGGSSGGFSGGGGGFSGGGGGSSGGGGASGGW